MILGRVVCLFVCLFVFLVFCVLVCGWLWKSEGGTRVWTGDLSICSRMLYHWAIPPISPLSQVHISNTTPYHNTFNYKHYNQRKNTTITTIQTNIHTQTLICMLRMDMDMQTIYHKQTKHQTPILQQHHHHQQQQQQQQSYTLQTNGVLSSNPTKHKHLVVGVRGMWFLEIGRDLQQCVESRVNHQTQYHVIVSSRHV